jgi:ABC-2 type transport system permease protein
MNLVLLPLWLVSGALFPMGTAHGWVQWLMRINPLTYTVAALRDTLVHPPAGTAPALSTSLIVTACFAAALFIASAVAANRKTTRSFA